MKFINNLLLLSAIALFPISSAFSQIQGDVYRPYSDAKVSDGTNLMQLPWVGGANRPQIAMADLNRDGREDIVLYEDYIGIKTLIATGLNTYKYDQKYEGSFPTIYGYLKLVDFNGDDIKDLVHRNSAGVGVYYGYYDKNVLKFKYYKDLYYTNPSGQVNVHVAPASIPAIADIDNDGDVDIIAYDVWGTTITYYRNCQVEEGLPKDTIKVCVKDICWGRTYQNFERQQVLHNSCQQWGTTCKGCPDPRGQQKGTHGSNTLLLIDMDNDGDLDWFNGNESFPDIQFFYNGKSENGGVDSAITQDTIWGANGKNMYMPIYPGAYLLNVNHNGGEDLLFTPMTEGTENYNSICLYENTGTNGNKNFVFKTNSYLIDRMIDMGIGSYPVFYDYDKDGKDDLFIGSDGFYEPSSGKNKSKIAYYRNTSTGEGQFSFTLETNDFLGLSAMNFEGAALAIGDIDNDSLDDLVIGRTDGTFAFFKNTANSNTVSPVWVKTVDVIDDITTLAPLDVGDYATPFIYDIDADGKNDLISGNQFGDLIYYQCVSAKGTLGVTKKTDNLGGIKLNKLTSAYAYSVPYIGAIDNTGIDYLMIGSEWGYIYRYDGFQNGAMPAQYTMLDSSYSYIDIGQRSAPAFANVDNDAVGLHELVVGNVLGGVSFYKQDFKVHINEQIAGSRDVKVYPNPANNVLNVNWGEGFANGNISVRLVSVTGQVIADKTFDVQRTGGYIEIGNVVSGTYYCVVQSGSNKSVHPVSVLK